MSHGRGSGDPTAAHLYPFCGSAIFPFGLWTLLYMLCISSRLWATEGQ